MKKIFFLLIGIIITFDAFSQNYYQFPDSNAIWNVYSIHVDNPQNVAYKIRYGIIGDTVIDTKIYSKIYRLINDTCLNINNAEFFGAIREENKQIFALTIYLGETEILLYDFSTEEGDTIVSNSPEGYMSYPVVISHIDSVLLLDGTTRKRFWINGSLDEFWIEGIGSQGGIFTPITDLLTNYFEPHLSCFKQNGSTVYLNNYSCNKCFCSLETSIKNTNRFQNEIQIFPNPAQDFLNIDNASGSYVQIFSITGMLISESEIKTDHFELKLNDVPEGMYFLRFEKDLEIQAKKIIVQR